MPSKLPRLIAIFIILFALCVTVLLIFGPRLGGHLARQALERAGIEGIDIGQIGYDLIDQEIYIAITQETAAGEEEGSISIAVDLGDLLDRTADIHTLRLEDLVIELIATEEGWEPRLPDLPKGGGNSPSWEWGIRQIDLHNLTLRFLSDPPVAVSSINGIIHNIDPATPRKPVNFEIGGSVAGGGISLRGEANPFATTPNADLRLHLDPLSLTRLAPVLPLPSGTTLKGGMKGYSDLHLSLLPTGMSLTGSALFTLNEAQLLAQGRALQFKAVEFGCSFQTGDGSFRLEEGYLAGKTLTAEQEDILLTLSTFDIEGITATNGEVSIAVVRSGEMHLAPLKRAGWSLPEGVESDGFSAKGVRLTPESGIIELLSIDGVMTALQLLPVAIENPQAEEQQPPSEEEEGTLEDTVPGKPWKWTIGEVGLSRPARTLLEDLRSDHPTSLLVEIERLSLAGLAGPGAANIALTAEGNLNRYARFEVTASAATDHPAGKGELKITSLSLPDITPYLQRNFGQRVKSGHLDLKADFVFSGNELEGMLDIHLGRLELEAVKDEKGEKGSNIPLRSALRLLRNSKGDIDLKIPVKGDRQAPDFSLNRVVTQAIVNGAKSGVTSYYAPVGISLITGVAVPAGALTVAGKVADWITSYRFREIPFPAGSAVLGQKELAYLDEVANLLQKRPSARLLICGYAGSSEQPEILTPATRKTLAGERSDDVKSYLVDQGIEPERLFLCDPTVDESPKAKGRVELLL